MILNQVESFGLKCWSDTTNQIEMSTIFQMAGSVVGLMQKSQSNGTGNIFINGNIQEKKVENILNI